jgi:hypothetical protein
VAGLSVATSYTVTDGIKDHKPMLVPRNQADSLRQQTTKLKAGSCSNSTGASTGFDHVEAFPDDVSKLSVAGCWLLAAGCWLLAAGCWLLAAGGWWLTAGCRFAIYGNLEFASTVLAADPVSARVGHLKGVRSLGDVHQCCLCPPPTTDPSSSSHPPR